MVEEGKGIGRFLVSGTVDKFLGNINFVPYDRIPAWIRYKERIQLGGDRRRNASVKPYVEFSECSRKESGRSYVAKGQIKLG